MCETLYNYAKVKLYVRLKATELFGINTWLCKEKIVYLRNYNYLKKLEYMNQQFVVGNEEKESLILKC